MKTLLSTLRPAFLLTAIFALVLCAAYPLAVWAFAQLAFPHKANGSLITDASGTVRGSALIAQPFAMPRYFHPRPSAAGDGYDATASNSSNFGPTSRKLADALKTRIVAYRSENALSADTPIPADAITASASGLDPHISVANAMIQAPRVAHARGFALDTVQALISANTAHRDFGVLGEEGVNVLLLNLALDKVSGTVTP